MSLSKFSEFLDVSRLREILASASGQGVSVGLIDTGVDSRHPALNGKVVANYEVEGKRKRLKVVPREQGIDYEEHGTACAGILHAAASAAEIHSVCVLDPSRKDTLEKLIAGLGFAIHQGWPVINISVGTSRFSQELFELAERAFFNGQILIAAKDNLPDQTGYPASLSSVIGVDMDHFDDPMDFIYHPQRSIEVEANGIYVEAPVPEGKSRLFTGTSFACPKIGAMAACLREAIPDLNAFQFRAVLAALSKK